jgi:pimeloyl-ACP methyl ester carboxylesterase
MSEIAFTEHRIDLDTGPVLYLKGGQGRPLLHLHPAGGRRVTPAIAQLARRHTIWIPTTPGYDGTPEHAAVASFPGLADLAAKFVRSVVGGRCDVMAESFGGWTALWLAVRHPDLVEQLVLEAPAGLRTTGGVPADPAARMRALYAVPERAPAETRSAEVLAKNRQAYERYARGVTLDTALEQALPTIRARTLLVFGTLDAVCPIETARRLKARIAQSHLTYIDGAAHVPEYDQPERVVRLVGAFLERGEAFLVRRSDAA